MLGQHSGSDVPPRPRQASPRRTLERYFHAVVTAVEQMASEPSPSREGHLERLEEIYCSLLGPAAAARGRGDGKRQARWAAVRGPCRGRQRAAPYRLGTARVANGVGHSAAPRSLGPEDAQELEGPGLIKR